MRHRFSVGLRLEDIRGDCLRKSAKMAKSTKSITRVYGLKILTDLFAFYLFLEFNLSTLDTLYHTLIHLHRNHRLSLILLLIVEQTISNENVELKLQLI